MFVQCLLNIYLGFAILWDDIEPELSEDDSKHFNSFAQAHCEVFPPFLCSFVARKLLARARMGRQMIY